ncbi:MAG: alkaline phosphatase family protein [Promethearchaeia archaeon]
MKLQAKKLLIIGVDQAIPYLVNKFLNKDKIPHIKSLVQDGTYGEAYCCAPCDTPTNWTTVATGATAGVHGATSFYLHQPGEPYEKGLEKRSRSQLSKFCNAQYLWDVADQEGMTPFVTNYPSGWHSDFKKGGMAVLAWPIPNTLPQTLSPKSSKFFNQDAEMEKKKIKHAQEPPKEIRSLSAVLKTKISFDFIALKEPYYLDSYIIDSTGKGYDSIVIESKQEKKLDIITNNEWSDWISIELETTHGKLPCLFKARIGQLEKDGSHLKLDFSPVFNTKGWTRPADLGEKFVKNVLSHNFMPQEVEIEYKISDDVASYLKYAQQETDTIGKAVHYAKKELNWDVCYFHVHLLDSVNHKELAYTLKDAPIYSKEEEKKANQNIENAYKIVDGMVGYLLEHCVDEETIVAFVSDHGAMPAWKIANIPETLVRADLLNYKWIESKKQYQVDWKNTSAFPYIEPPFIWINKKGRDPQGIVSESKYEEIRDRVIEVLEGMRDPNTGDKIVKLAMRKEEADILGLNGERVGDVVYFLNPPYQIYDEVLEQLNPSFISPKYMEKPEAYPARHCFGAHVYYLPTQKFGNYSNSVPIILKGPGIKEGYQLDEIINLVDLAPTLSHMLDIPQPADTSGRVLYDILY